MELTSNLLREIESVVLKLAPGFEKVEIPNSCGMTLVIPGSSEFRKRESQPGVIVGSVIISGKEFVVCNK
ncbi:MAG: hypothetical protein EXS46_03975 [Candidatus Taylorbacteria bacterium]|nr:hypothetical protein [Candidatus Taylorbacteria bacterium]